MTIDEIITRHRAWANINKRESFFNPLSMAFFATKVFPKVYRSEDNVDHFFFITSEQYKATEYGKLYCGYKDGPVGYTVRCFHNGEITTCGDFQMFFSFKDAEHAILTPHTGFH